MTQVSESADPGAEEINLAREAGFSIGPLGVSPSTREVGSAGRMETIEPRVMQVLVCLFHALGQVVSRDDLIQRCWGGRIVGEDAINRCIAKVRRIAEMTAEPAFEIETIPRVGYRLNRVPDSPRAELPPAPTSAATDRRPRRWVWLSAGIVLAAIVGLAAPRLLRPAPPKPWSDDDHRMSFAVLPLAAGKDDVAADYAAALTDELTAGLSSVPAIGAILPRSKVTSVDPSGGPETVGRRLQVAYLIEGTVRRQDDHFETRLSIIRVANGTLLGTAQLSEPIAVRHDPLREDLMRAVATLTGYSGAAELERINGLPEEQRDARDLVILLEEALPGNNDMAGANAMVALSEKAFARARDEPHVQAALAESLAYRGSNGWSADTEEDLRRATTLVGQVLAKDPRNLTALHVQLLIFLAQQRDDEAIALADTMIALDPYWRAIYFDKAICLVRLGRNEEALAVLNRMPHSADDELPTVRQVYGEVYLAMGRYPEAATHMRSAMAGLSPSDYGDPNSAGTLLELAAIESLLGRIGPAKEMLRRFREANPGVATISDLRAHNYYFMGQSPATIEKIFDALRKAGMAE